MKIGIYKLTFSHDTIKTLRKMREENPAILKEEACKRLGVSMSTMNNSANRAGLREELNDIFPRTSYVRARKPRECGSELGELPVDFNNIHIRMATSRWV